ncbi:MAG: FGGY family carbohydrate kinase [Actinobacteria bacterium]|nr:FGGY family carbohydrate kinase [Actinomycetota bacterium]
MASKYYIISSDLGSQSIKTVLYDGEGNDLASSVRESKIYVLGPGTLIYQGDDFYYATLENIRSVLRDSNINPKNVAVLSFTGVGGGVIGVDNNWGPTCEYTNTLDTRDQLYFERVVENFGDLIRSKSGIGSPQGANKILWIKNEYPEIYKKTKKFMIVTQYVQGKLTGLKSRDAFMDITTPAITGLADTEHHQWSEEICNALKIDMGKLPRIVEPQEIIGTLTKNAASYCGLPAGVPVIAGVFDKPSGLIGSGSVEVGSIVDEAATHPALTTCVEKFAPDLKHKTLVCSPSAIKGIWMAWTYIIGGGLTHKWYLDTFCKSGIPEVDGNGNNAYMILDEEAREIKPGSEGLIFLPHLSGRATPSEPEARGLWIGFTWTHRKAHFYRSILEGIAYDYACSLRTVKANYPRIDFIQVKAIGGGSVSELWNQIKSDVLDIPYVRLNRTDLATLGAAIIGGKAVGIFSDVSESARRFVKITERINPNPEVHKYYQNYVDIYKELYKSTKSIYSQLAHARRI